MSLGVGSVWPRRHDLDVVQLSCKDAHLPPEVRLGFVKKVYGILGTMRLTWTQLFFAHCLAPCFGPAIVPALLCPSLVLSM